MSFGSRLKLIREEKELSREELAKSLNISYSAISKYETDVRFPDQDILKKIADFFAVSIDYLLSRTDKRKSNTDNTSTKAYHNLDMEGLSDEDIKKVEEYVEFIKRKYNPDGTPKEK